jgi:hypothetical protein
MDSAPRFVELKNTPGMKTMTLESLDQATTALVARLHAALQERQAQSLRFTFRMTPEGSVGAPDYWFLDEGSQAEVKDYPSSPVHRAVSESAEAHWSLTEQLGQARWYQIAVSVERSGRYGVDFEYRDNYQEGDIHRQT